MMRVWVTLAFVFILSGCTASGPTYTNYASSIPALETNKARVFLYRPSVVFGSGIRPDIEVRQNKIDSMVGELPNGSFAFIDVEPGPVRLRTISRGYIVPDANSYFDFKAEPNEVYYFDVTIVGAERSLMATIMLGPVSPSKQPAFRMTRMMDPIEAKLKMRELNHQKLDGQ